MGGDVTPPVTRPSRVCYASRQRLPNYVPYSATMPPRIGQKRALGRNYIREWRLNARLSQDRLVERVREHIGNFTKASLSRIENSKQPYSQPILEAIAWALNCFPADLLKPIPQPETELQRFINHLSQNDQERALRVLRAALVEAA